MSVIVGNSQTAVSGLSTAKSITFTSSSSSNMKNISGAIKGIIFDIDGTLADSWRLGFDATQVVLENNNIEKISEELYHECTRYTTPDRLARHAGLLPEQHGEDFLNVGAKLAQEFDDLYVNLVSKKTAGFYDGIGQMLTRIPTDIQVGALTNACVGYALAVLETNDNIKPRFSTIHGADSVPKPKPFGDGLLLCCKEMNLKPEECIYIGDSPSDGQAAEAAGMTSIGVLWGSHGKESLEKAPFGQLCSTVNELDEVLLSLLSIKENTT